MMEETGVNIDFKEANEEKHYNNVVSLIGHSEIAKKIVMLSTLRPASFGDYVNYICMSHSNIGWRRRQRYSDIIDESIITYEDAYEKFLSFGLGENEMIVKEEYTEMNINESFYSDYIVWSYMRREGITIYE
jgi:hypothetical protein